MKYRVTFEHTNRPIIVEIVEGVLRVGFNLWGQKIVCLEKIPEMSYNMHMKSSDAVREFHTKFGIPKAHPADVQSVAFRIKLIEEEYEEVRDAAGRSIKAALENRGCEPVHMLKELADLAYVIYGTAEAFGWDLDEAVRRVHESNMSKLGADGKPIYREDGKVLKGPNYQEPYLGDLV